MRRADFHAHGRLPFFDMRNGRVAHQRHVLAHSWSERYLLYNVRAIQACRFRVREGSTLILVKLPFTGMPLKARKYGKVRTYVCMQTTRHGLGGLVVFNMDFGGTVIRES